MTKRDLPGSTNEKSAISIYHMDNTIQLHVYRGSEERWCNEQEDSLDDGLEYAANDERNHKPKCHWVQSAKISVNMGTPDGEGDWGL